MPRARFFFLVICLLTMSGFNAWGNNFAPTFNQITASGSPPASTQTSEPTPARDSTTPTFSTASTNTSQQTVSPQPPVPIAASTQTPKLKLPVVQSLEHHAPFRVGVLNMPPFTFPSGGGQWSGLAVTLFQHIANSSGLRYSITEFENLSLIHI